MTATPTPTEMIGTIGTKAVAAAAGATGTLPVVRSPLSVDDVLARVREASKRGRMPGFVVPSASTSSPMPDFHVNAFGTPFEADLLARLESAVPTTGPTDIHFELQQRRAGLLGFIALLVLSVWPGVLVVDSMIPGEWGWPNTWYWYIPLTALPIPWAIRSIRRKTLASTTASAHEMIEKIRAEVDGTIA